MAVARRLIVVRLRPQTPGPVAAAPLLGLRKRSNRPSAVRTLVVENRLHGFVFRGGVHQPWEVLGRPQQGDTGVVVGWLGFSEVLPKSADTLFFFR